MCEARWDCAERENCVERPIGDVGARHSEILEWCTWSWKRCTSCGLGFGVITGVVNVVVDNGETGKSKSESSMLSG